MNEMQHEQIKSLGIRAVACGDDFAWEQGMADLHGNIIAWAMDAEEAGGGAIVVRWVMDGDVVTDLQELDAEDDIPDFSDDATIGCLLGMVCRKYGVGIKPGIVIAVATDYSESYDMDGGRFEVRRGDTVLFRASGGCRAERLVRALEAKTADHGRES